MKPGQEKRDRAEWGASVLMTLLAIGAWYILTGCTTPIQPQTTRQQVAVATVTLTGVYNGIATLAETGQLTTAEYGALMQSADRAHGILLVAVAALRDGDTASSAQHLLFANRILLELHSQLANRRGGAP